MTIDQKSQTLKVGDWIIIAAYFVLCLGVGLFSKFRKNRGKTETAEGYFLAGRSMMWWAVGPSLFASNIGSEHFIGLAGSGAATGIGVVSYEWQETIMLRPILALIAGIDLDDLADEESEDECSVRDQKRKRKASKQLQESMEEDEGNNEEIEEIEPPAPNRRKIDKMKLLEATEVYVDRTKLRVATMAAQNKGTNGAQFLLQKLIPLVFSVEELANYCGQRMTIPMTSKVISGPSKKLLDAVVSACKAGSTAVKFDAVYLACWVLLLLGWIFVPIYLKSRVFTMPEYLKKRFQSRWVRTYLTAVALISYVFTKTSVDIYAGSVFLYEAVGWNVYISAAVILVITALYTLLGGLMAVIFTDVLQCAIMIIGAIVLAILSFIRVGGYDGLWNKYPTAIGSPYVPPTSNSSMVNACIALLNATNSTNSTRNSYKPTPNWGNISGEPWLWITYPTATSSPYVPPTNNSSIVDACIALLNATNSTSSTSNCYKLTPYWGNMFRPLDDPDYPWLGLWTTLPIMGIWYWCTDQVIVQRALGAKNNVHAKAGSIFAGLLKILPIFIMVMPGMISRVLFPDSIACADSASCLQHCGNKWGCTNNAYPKLVLNVLPTGLVGLMMAVMMAALMSSLSSAFNSSATIFTVDVWLIFRPQAKEREKLVVGRIVVLLLVVISLVWLPIIQGAHGSQLFVYIQTIQSYLAPPITMVFGLGILWPRLTAAGALSGLLIGFFMGMLKFVLGNIFSPPECGQPDDRPGFVKMHFMYYAIIVFGVSGIVMAVVSFFTKPVPRNELGGLTWSTINEPPLACGAIGEEGVEHDPERAANGTVHPKNPDAVQLMEMKDETKTDDKNDVNHEKNPALFTNDKVYLEVVQFHEESLVIKWVLRLSSLLVLALLAFLWTFYR